MVVLPWSHNIPEIRFYGHGGPTMESRIPEIRFYGHGGPTMESQHPRDKVRKFDSSEASPDLVLIFYISLPTVGEVKNYFSVLTALSAE
ncbi:hypothetical protein RRG08_057738 [Elysia crispata]|uniref:Uncharacterized protein n=1 Tax=Elysia crispata TaxID=231223 RepID=A0AAE0YA87_9GAST|nr:hypothetical protein RRG08_057738 [Elysia crispata]